MSIITGHQRNANQNHIEIPPHAKQNGNHLKIRRQQMLQRMWINRNAFTRWWECKLIQPLWKTVWQFSKDLEVEIALDPAIPLLGIYPKDYKSFYYKDTCTHTFTAALFTITNTWNQCKCPSMIDQIKKIWHIYTMEYTPLCSHKKERDHVLCRNMDGVGSHYSQQTNVGT